MAPPNPVAIEKPRKLQRFLVQGSAGALIGFVISSLNGPALVSWLYKPLRGDALNCANTVSEALIYFVRLQLLAGRLGGGFVLFISFLLRRSLSRRRAAKVLPRA